MEDRESKDDPATAEDRDHSAPGAEAARLEPPVAGLGANSAPEATPVPEATPAPEAAPKATPAPEAASEATPATPTPDPIADGEASTGEPSLAGARPLRAGKEGDYREPDPRELRLAGWGCIGLVVATALFLVIVFVLAFGSLDDLGGGPPTATVVSEAPPPEPPVAPSEPRPTRVRWTEDVEGAFERSQVERKPVVVLFEAPWATASQDLRDGSFEDPSVADLMDSFIALRVDMQSLDASAIALKEAHEVRFVPHVLFLDSEREPLRPPSQGLMEPADLRVLLSDALEVHRVRRAAPATDDVRSAPPPPTGE